MMPNHFTTSGAPASRRLALWQDIVCDVFVQLDCKSDMGAAFDGSVTYTKLGPAIFSDVASCKQRVYRTPSRIAHAREEMVLVALGRKGTGAVLQDNREAVIRPGEFAIYDTTRPYELQFNDIFTQTILQIPPDMLSRRLPGADALTAVSFDPARPLARLAYDFVATLSTIAGSVDAATGERLADQAVDLIAIALSERLSGSRLPPSTHRAAMLYRLKEQIERRLHDPGLSLSQIAAMLGISTRYVNDLLALEQTSFQRYLLQRRLERCRRDLATSPARRQIGEIAFAWGFNDLSHFGRAFRERYGLTPRDWRNRQRTEAERL